MPRATSSLQSSYSPLQITFPLETLESSCDLTPCPWTPQCVCPTNKGIVSHPRQDASYPTSGPVQVTGSPGPPFTTGRVGGRGVQASTTRPLSSSAQGTLPGLPSVLPQGGFSDVSSLLVGRSQELSHQGPTRWSLGPSPPCGPCCRQTPVQSVICSFTPVSVGSVCCFIQVIPTVTARADARIDPDSVTRSLSKLARVLLTPSRSACRGPGPSRFSREP